MKHLRKQITGKQSTKKISLLLILLLAMSLILFTSCGGTDDTETDDGTGISDGQQTDPGNDNESSDNSENSGDNDGSEPGDDNGSDASSGDEQTGDVAHPTYVPSREVRTTDDGNLLVIVNKEFAVSPDYYPTDMVDIDGSLSTNQNLKVKREAYDAYLTMLEDAQAEGLNFCICSAYRSYALQESLYNNSLSANGQAYTEKMFAYPGKSEHHTGYAIDVTSASMNWGLAQDFTDYPDGAWITEHCAEYGFIIRYPKGKEDITGYVYEPWHIRYVGIDVAQYITEQGITFEEYLGVA